MTKSGTQVKNTDFPVNETVLTATEWTDGGERTPVYAIVSAVAELEGADPVELPPLYEVIDPDALNALFASKPDTAPEQVTFEYAGYVIDVRGCGEVRVRSTR